MSACEIILIVPFNLLKNLKLKSWDEMNDDVCMNFSVIIF